LPSKIKVKKKALEDIVAGWADEMDYVVDTRSHRKAVS